MLKKLLILIMLMPLASWGQQYLDMCDEPRTDFDYSANCNESGNFYWLVDNVLYESGTNTINIDWAAFSPGAHVIELGFTSSYGCVADPRFFTVGIAPCLATSAYIPNSFTPDNDGLNEEWFPVFTNARSVKTIIANRWGDVVFESESLEPKWIGNMLGGEYYVPDGVYVYRIEVHFNDVSAEVFQGHITLLR
jgi:gliding motility-associated-like protein